MNETFFTREVEVKNLFFRMLGLQKNLGQLPTPERAKEQAVLWLEVCAVWMPLVELNTLP